MTARELLEAALALPAEERALLVDELAASLPQDDEDDAFVEMVNKRIEAADAGAPGTPAETVFAELLGE